MKKYLLSLLALVSVHFCNAQVSLEHSYNAGNISFTTILSAAGDKIYMWDSATVYMYNMDHSSYKVIYPTVAGYRLTQVLFPSDRLFNSDDNVEFVGVFYNSALTPNYRAGIFNESGTMIQDLGNAYFANLHYNAAGTNYKLFMFTIHAGPPMWHTTDVYACPGSMPCGQCGQLGVEKPNPGSGSISDPMPNPSDGVTRINYTLPLSSSTGMLVFTDSRGAVVKQVPVFSNTDHIDINNTTLAPGIYLYTLTAGGGVSTARTMMIK